MLFSYAEEQNSSVFFQQKYFPLNARAHSSTVMIILSRHLVEKILLKMLRMFAAKLILKLIL